MAKIVSAYKTLTIESALTKDDLKKALRYDPNSASLYGEDKNTQTFAIATDSPGCGTVSAFGIVFDGVTTEGKLFITVADEKIPADKEARKSFIEDNYGSILYKLNQTEASVVNCLARISSEVDAITNSIEIL